MSRKIAGNDSLFTSSTVPTTAMVRDTILRKDSWIDSVCGHDWKQHNVVELYDAEGTGRRAGQIYLRNTPMITVDRVEYRLEGGQGGAGNNRSAWIPGVAGDASEALGVLVGPSANIAADYYYVYPEKAMVWWGRVRYSIAQKYRVTYSYGYPSPPEHIRDWSATLAALECRLMFAGQFVPADPTIWTQLELDADRFLTMTGRRPLAGSA